MISSPLLPNQRSNLEQLLKQHIKVIRKDGDEWNGLCPFCNGGYKREEKFYIDMKSGLSICHRAVKCGWAGNAVSFISELMNCSYEEAKRILNEGRDNSITYLMSLLTTFEEELETELKDEVWIEGAIPFSESPTRLQTDVLSWLNRRGYTQAFDSLWMPPEGLYRGRVIFKVTSGRVKGYQLYDYTGKSERKTINPEREFLSRTLYRYDEWKSSDRPILIHEGIFDVERSRLRGFNATCVFGTNLSDSQHYLLSCSNASEIIVCLDGDTKTEDIKKDKAWKMAQALTTTSKPVSLVRLPINEDPDSCKEVVFRGCLNKRTSILSREDWLIGKLSTR